MASLCIVIIVKINAVKGVECSCIRWIRLIVSLDVSAKGIVTMLVVVESALMENHTWTVIGRNSVLGGEEIQLLGRIHNEDLDHDAWYMLIR